ncbi:MAG: SgcJ/EcaC family oxidoreductase [Saprospiraceae bacterium]|nr:SgcJ/EcaC family oxidoreductase [Saprospiraceae bacterium]
MKKIIISLILLIGLNLSAQESSEVKARNQIENKIKTLVDAWAIGDAELFASSFSEDADFTVWFGMKLKGKKEIAFGHSIIFKEFYANTVWNLKIDKIRFVGPEVALVHCSGSVLKSGEDNLSEPDAVPLLVFQKIDEDWKIITLQNTPFAVNEFRANGDIRRMKKIIRAYKD